MKTVAYKSQKVVNVKIGHVGAWVNVNGEMKFVVIKKLK
jgi:hypothetical protein